MSGLMLVVVLRRREKKRAAKRTEEDRARKDRETLRGERVEEGQSGSGNDRPSALEANIDECPALLALRNRENMESLSFFTLSPPVSFFKVLPRQAAQEHKQSRAENGDHVQNLCE